jgi:tryptophan 2,3-dioxygenase
MNEQILLEKLRKLESKYEASGQNLESYLDGLYEADFLNYWDYIHIDTLLSLQTKRTTLPDEEIFIIYHQVTELYFRLILVELEQICKSPEMEIHFLETRLSRVNRYFDILVHSFTVMSEGMDAAQFMKFRMALLPASGFQSVQYRLIELSCTSVDNLLDQGHRSRIAGDSIEEKMPFLYWRSGSTDAVSGKKTLTLTRFEEKYDITLLDFANRHKDLNLYDRFRNLDWNLDVNQPIRLLLRQLDNNANIAWRMAHIHAASKYLKKPDSAVNATGGTDWQRYLPPRFQKLVFFPFLWSPEELANWGKPGEFNSTVKPF